MPGSSGKANVDLHELQRPGEAAGQRGQHAARHHRPWRVQPGGHHQRRRHRRLRPERLDHPRQQPADPVGDHGDADRRVDVLRARELHRRGQLRLERRDHQRQPGRRQHHHDHDQRDDHQDPDLAEHHPHRADPARRHEPGRLRGTGAVRHHHAQQPGHDDDEHRHHRRSVGLLRGTGHLQQWRDAHRGRRHRHRDHDQPAVHQQRHGQGQRRHPGDQHPRLQADRWVHATGRRRRSPRPSR